MSSYYHCLDRRLERVLRDPSCTYKNGGLNVSHLRKVALKLYQVRGLYDRASLIKLMKSKSDRKNRTIVQERRKSATSRKKEAAPKRKKEEATTRQKSTCFDIIMHEYKDIVKYLKKKKDNFVLARRSADRALIYYCSNWDQLVNVYGAFKPKNIFMGCVKSKRPYKGQEVYTPNSKIKLAALHLDSKHYVRLEELQDFYQKRVKKIEVVKGKAMPIQSADVENLRAGAAVGGNHCVANATEIIWNLKELQ